MLQRTKNLLGKDWIEKGELQDLCEVLRYHEKCYYVNQSPEISDLDYDHLFKLLKNFEKEHPEDILEDSPTQRIAHNVQKDFKTRHHLKPMLSLDNTYNEEDLRKFDQQVRDGLKRDNVEYIVELKFDGISISLNYRSGDLKRALTRGNGLEGEDVTLNAKTIPQIPLSINNRTFGEIEIRGEVIMPKDVFLHLNERQEELGLNNYVNTRNAASGSLRQLNSAITKERNLDAYFYQIISEEDTRIKTYLGVLDFLRRNDFKVSPLVFQAANIDEVIKICHDQNEKRFSYPFEIDGLVIKVNNFEDHRILGETSHHPKWAIAYKFPAQRAQTKILNILVQVGRTGVLTPVAVLEPVFLSGATISRATLHNQDEIDKKDIRIGDTVVIERAGEVIPSVIEVKKNLRPGNTAPYKIPTICPICNEKTDRLPEEVAIRCLNLNCPAQIKGRITHFASKNCMDIDGLGEKLVDKFVDQGLITKISDIYHIKDHSLDLVTQKNIGGKTITNLLNAIEKSKNNDLWRLIHGLGIKYIGKNVAKTLAENLNNLLELNEMTEDEFKALPDIGEKTALSLKDFFENEGNKTLLKDLQNAGLNYDKKNSSKDNKLENKNFVITGQFKTIKRSELEKIIEENGGQIKSAVSKNTDYLILGDNPGSKFEEAKALQIPILKEDDFFAVFKLELKKEEQLEIEQNSLF